MELPMKLKGLLTVERDHFDYAMIAIAAHEDQKYGDYPYSYHLAMVDNYACDFGFNEHKYRAAAWLHDVVEDTSLTITDVCDVFGVDIAMMVWACTGVGATRSERSASIYERLKHHPEGAIIKCADRYANVKFSMKSKNKKKLGTYLQEWTGFKKNVMPLMVGVGDHRKAYLFNCLDDLMGQAKEIFDALPDEGTESSE